MSDRPLNTKSAAAMLSETCAAMSEVERNECDPDLIVPRMIVAAFGLRKVARFYRDECRRLREKLAYHRGLDLRCSCGWLHKGVVGDDFRCASCKRLWQLRPEPMRWVEVVHCLNCTATVERGKHDVCPACGVS